MTRDECRGGKDGEGGRSEKTAETGERERGREGEREGGREGGREGERER